MKLPNEAANRAIIRERLEPELKLASRILDLGVGMCFSVRMMQPHNGLDSLGLGVALGLITRACKQCRAIGELVGMGLGEVADSNVRMLFETMLAVEFILRRQMILKQKGVRLPAINGKPLTTKFRTSLYLAKDAFNYRKLAKGLLETPGQRRIIGRRSHTSIDRDATQWERVIGPEWTKRLKRGYAGVNIEHLTESLGFGQLYAMYRIQSSGIRAGDATLGGYPFVGPLEMRVPLT
jgi:hypothetical protein